MSYCRFGWGGSEVYVYASGGNTLVCCGCRFDDDNWANCETPEAMIEHLIKHRKAGHFVPAYAIERLWSEIDGASVPTEPEPEEMANLSREFNKIRDQVSVEKFEEVLGPLGDNDRGLLMLFCEYKRSSPEKPFVPPVVVKEITPRRFIGRE